MKDTSAGMDTHLPQEVTTLAMAVLVERTDKVKFHLTTSSESVTIDVGDGDGEQVYSASEGVARSNIQSDSELNVDNLDVIGIFDNVLLKELELRRGLFDFAEFRIFVFNHQDTSDGIIKMFRGQFGEVITTSMGYFQVQVRSLVQVYSKMTGELYGKDCRADLGDIRCRVPLIFDEGTAADRIDRTFPVSNLFPNMAYQLGDFLTVLTAPDVANCAQIVHNFEGVDGATSGAGFDNIGNLADPIGIVGTTQIDTAQMPAGGTSTSSCLFDGNSDYIQHADDPRLTINGDLTIQAHIRLNATGVNHTIASQWDSDGNQRAWNWRVLAVGNFLNFQLSTTGAGMTDEVTGTTALTTGVDYHVALTRNGSTWEIWLDGVSEGSFTQATDPINSSSIFRIGVLDETLLSQWFNGWIDSFEFLNGAARWSAPFTPPTGNKVIPALNPIWEDYGDRIYEVTVAGTSGQCITTPDTTIGNTHTQGGATLTANHSWMRFAQVIAVDGVDPRRKFTVTELTPISGQAVGSNSLPSALGFPNDWFNGGATKFETGDNAGRAIEVRDFTAGAGSQVIELITDMPFDVVIGDKLRVFAGCDKTSTICINKFNNAPNAVAEWFVPGEDTLGQYPDAR